MKSLITGFRAQLGIAALGVCTAKPLAGTEARGRL